MTAAAAAAAARDGTCTALQRARRASTKAKHRQNTNRRTSSEEGFALQNRWLTICCGRSVRLPDLSYLCTLHARNREPICKKHCHLRLRTRALNSTLLCCWQPGPQTTPNIRHACFELTLMHDGDDRCCLHSRGLMLYACAQHPVQVHGFTHLSPVARRATQLTRVTRRRILPKIRASEGVQAPSLLLLVGDEVSSASLPVLALGALSSSVVALPSCFLLFLCFHSVTVTACLEILPLGLPPLSGHHQRARRLARAV